MTRGGPRRPASSHAALRDLRGAVTRALGQLDPADRDVTVGLVALDAFVNRHGTDTWLCSQGSCRDAPTRGFMNRHNATLGALLDATSVCHHVAVLRLHLPVTAIVAALAVVDDLTWLARTRHAPRWRLWARSAQLAYAQAARRADPGTADAAALAAVGEILDRAVAALGTDPGSQALDRPVGEPFAVAALPAGAVFDMGPQEPTAPVRLPARPDAGVDIDRVSWAVAGDATIVVAGPADAFAALTADETSITAPDWVDAAVVVPAPGPLTAARLAGAYAALDDGRHRGAVLADAARLAARLR